MALETSADSQVDTASREVAAEDLPGARGPVLSRRVELIAAMGLFLCLVSALAYSVVSDGLTMDETDHTAAAYRYVARGDYRANPEHPPIAKLLAGVPLLGLDVTVPPILPQQYPPEWAVSFISGSNLSVAIVPWARVPLAGLTVALAGLLWVVSRRLYGQAAGLVALALIAFHPSLIAHGHLVTTDVPAAFFFLLYSCAFYRWSRAPSLGRATVAMLALGLATCTRFTGWILVLTSLLLLLPWLVERGRPRLSSSLRQLGTLFGSGLVLVPLVMWAVYGFRFEAYPGESVWHPVDAGLGRGGALLAWLHDMKLFPEAYLEGMRFVMDHNRDGHPSYLLGTISDTGWWYYHLVAYLVKNTPGFLLMTGLALAIWLRGGRELLRRGAVKFRAPRFVRPATLHWLLPVVVIFVMASAARIQLGERYALQIHPYLILLFASVVPQLLAVRWGAVALAGVVAAHALPSATIAPSSYLTYFNFIAGGPDGAYRWLADSNLDWGQDLPRLAAWLKARGNPHIQLGYFGSDEPMRYGLDYYYIEEYVMPLPEGEKPSGKAFEGMVAVSTNTRLGFLWSYDFPGHENPYDALRDVEPVDRVGSFFIYDFPPQPASASTSTKSCVEPARCDRD